MLTKAHAFLFKNTGFRQTVLKNAFWLFSSQATGHALRAIVVIYAARVLGAAGFGTASYALSLAGIFAVITDMGLGTILTKSIVQHPEERDRHFATVFALKCACAAAGFAAVLAIGPFVTRIPEAVALLPLAALVLMFDGMRNLGIAFVRAKEKMEWEAGLMLFTNALTVALGLGLVALWKTPGALLAAYAAGSGIGLAAALWALRGYLAKTISHFDSSIAKDALKQALPLALANLLGGTMLNIDTIMIGWWKGAAEIGLYAAAQKPIQLAYGLAGVIGASLFPAFSRAAATDMVQFRSLLKRSMRPILAASAGASFFCAVFAKDLLVAAYGPEYAPAAGTFAILAFTLMVNAPIIVGFSAILAAGKQKIYLWSAPVEALSNAGLNALLIPRIGIEGAALSTLVTQLAVNAYLWKKIRAL